jgi:hypothetical protein
MGCELLVLFLDLLSLAVGIDVHATLVRCVESLNFLFSGLNSLQKGRVFCSHLSLRLKKLINFFLEALGALLSSLDFILPDLHLLLELIGVSSFVDSS